MMTRADSASLVFTCGAYRQASFFLGYAFGRGRQRTRAR
jgi:hypothetical protein